MAYDPGMIQPKRKQPAAPEIETDLLRIQQLSQEHDDENWEFRSWLKQNAPDNIDGIVKALSQKYFSLIDCTQCANCCRSLQTEFKKSELHAIAKTLGQSLEAFEKQFMSEGMVNPPCPMLDGKLCSIYENSPEVCRCPKVRTLRRTMLSAEYEVKTQRRRRRGRRVPSSSMNIELHHELTSQRSWLSVP
jgi:Fe-S-cluster containining protein